MPVYALNMFNVCNKEEYKAYSKRSVAEVSKHGGKVVLLGKYRDSVAGDIAPRNVLIIVEWESKQAFESYCNAPDLRDLHAHRENGTSEYIWQLFDKLDDLRPILS